MQKKKPSEIQRFTLVLADVSELSDEMCDALYDAGCDDALVGARDGIVFIDFSREEALFRDAVLSAIGAVESAGIGAKVARVDQVAPGSEADASLINATLEMRRFAPSTTEAVRLVKSLMGSRRTLRRAKVSSTRNPNRKRTVKP